MKQTKYSLYSALGLIVVTVVVSVVTIYSTVSYFYSKNAIVEEMESRSETSIVFLRQDLAHHIEAYAINEYEILISNEMDASDFFAIVVTDYNMGEIIGQDGYVTGKIRDADWNIADYDPENSEQNGALERCYYSDTDIIVSESGERLGTISICSSDRSLQQELEDTIFRNVIYTFSISLFLILLLFFMIRRVVIRPVSEIVNGLLAIDESGLPREKVATLGPPEIRILGTSINSMIDAVHMRETELLQSEERIRLLLDSTAEGIYGLDLEGNCTFANKMCLKLTGYQDVDELIGKNMHELIHHTHNDGSPYPVEKCHIYRAFKEGRGTHVIVKCSGAVMARVFRLSTLLFQSEKMVRLSGLF